MARRARKIAVATGAITTTASALHRESTARDEQLLPGALDQRGGAAAVGEVVRIDPSGRRTVIATGLTFPSAITFGPDRALYVSNLGFAGAGAGQIVRITVPCR